MNKTITLLVMALWLCVTPVLAQKADNEATRQRWMTEIRNYKHEYLIRELKLSREQQREFFEQYDAMDDELAKINKETRDLEDKYRDDSKATDLELSQAARALYEQKQCEAEVEMRYYDQIKEILTPRQLFKLRPAERKFTTQMVRHHSRLRKGAAEKK